LKLTSDIQELKPTLFASVPRLYNKIYDKIVGSVNQAGGAKKSLFETAVAAKVHNLETRCQYTHAIYDPLIFNKVKQIFGGRVRLMTTGSAPISRDVSNFFKIAFCVPIMEGYGQTETGGAPCLSHDTDPRTQHVGGPIGSAKIRLRDVPEMGYLTTDNPPRGEIQFYGPCVFKGYFKNQEKTKEAFDEDGWLCTGDVGVIHENGSVQIIDRAKNIFKLS